MHKKPTSENRFEGELTFRELSRADLPKINAWRNDPQIVMHLGANHLFITEEVDERWYDNYLARRTEFVRLAILEPISKRMIGLVCLVGIHPINRSAEFSLMVGESDSWSKGYGFKATTEVLKHAFMDLNLHRVHLTVTSENEPARKLYEKAGFLVEGELREAVFKGGKFCNLIMMGILQAEWCAITKQPPAAS